MGGRAAKAPVPKTGCAKALGGANPSPSATQAISSTAERRSPKPQTEARHLHGLPLPLSSEVELRSLVPATVVRFHEGEPYSHVAQSVERAAVNREVLGSRPSVRAIRDLAELADAPASEAGGDSRAGSTPAVPTIPARSSVGRAAVSRVRVPPRRSRQLRG